MWKCTGTVVTKDADGKEHRHSVEYFPGIPTYDLEDDQMKELEASHPEVKGLQENGYFVHEGGKSKKPVTAEGDNNGDHE